MRNTWLVTTIVLLAVLALAMLLKGAFPSALDGQFNLAHLIYLFALLAFIGSSFFASQRMNLSLALKQALAWVAIFAVVIVGYTYKNDFALIGDRVSGELVPSRPTQASAGAVLLHRQANGHFGVDAKVNGARISFMVDTGASDVALTYKDAERAGLEPWNLNFDRPYQTANGVTYGARVDIQSIAIGDITLYNIRGSVMRQGMDESLLGLSYLNRLGSYNVSGNKMTLRR
jgi:aspartyl protease family protein